MIKFNCQTTDSIKLCDLSPFQGDLKKRTPEQVKELMYSLVNDGLMMPFAVWKTSDKNYILDGHGRLQAYLLLSKEDPTIFTDVDFPCVFISADTEEDARKALLQITSSYGNITRKGAIAFCKSIPTYRAPSINVVLKKPLPKSEKPKEATIKIRVPKEHVEAVRSILAEVDYITVL